MYRDDRSWYDTAQICLNGHIITTTAIDTPEEQQNFCQQCGAKTISDCPNCSEPIRGYHHIPGIADWGEDSAPAFCINCGNPFPWTVSSLEAARDLINEIENLSQPEKDEFTGTLPDVISDTPRTILAATRFKKYASKAGNVVASALRDILIDIASETAKKTMFGQ